MASVAFLKLAGVKGPAVQKADTRLNHIQLFAVTHEVGAQVDAEGKAGDRRHHPIYVTKNIDFTTPRLHRALTEGEEFGEGHINFFHMPRSGDERNYYSIVLTGIRVISIKSVMPSTQDPVTTDIHEYEEVGLMYKGISWISHSPEMKTLEAGAYKGNRIDEPEGKFGPDWIEEEAHAAAMDILNAVKEEVKTRLMNEAKKKAAPPKPE